MRKVFLVGAAICAALVALDQWLKGWTMQHLPGNPRVIVEGIFRLVYVENTGAAFGFLADFAGAQWLFAGLKILLLTGMAVYYFWLPYERLFWAVRVPLVAIFAGGVGNLIDRLRLGFVVDMFQVQFFNFPVFNLADVFVTVGVFALAFVMLFVVKDVPIPGGGVSAERESE